MPVDSGGATRRRCAFPDLHSSAPALAPDNPPLTLLPQRRGQEGVCCGCGGRERSRCVRNKTQLSSLPLQARRKKVFTVRVDTVSRLPLQALGKGNGLPAARTSTRTARQTLLCLVQKPVQASAHASLRLRPTVSEPCAVGRANWAFEPETECPAPCGGWPAVRVFRALAATLPGKPHPARAVAESGWKCPRHGDFRAGRAKMPIRCGLRSRLRRSRHSMRISGQLVRKSPKFRDRWAHWPEMPVDHGVARGSQNGGKVIVGGGSGERQAVRVARVFPYDDRRQGRLAMRQAGATEKRRGNFGETLEKRGVPRTGNWRGVWSGLGKLSGKSGSF